MKIKDLYYDRPILYDYLIAFILLLVLFLLEKYNFFQLPCSSKSSDFASDLGAIGLTVSGFILTLITILLTLKSGQLLSEDKLTNKSSPFKIFLSSKMYNRSVDILKHGVLSLVLISILLYILKLTLPTDYLLYIFYINILGLVIILTTFLRCFYIIGLIMRMQQS
jgi:hypothetical protein